MNLVESGLIQLFVSQKILSEIEEVLNQTELRTRFPALSDEIVGAFLKRLEEFADLVERVPYRFSYLRDQDAEPYIHLAITTDASLVVVRDKDLLDFMTGTDNSREFRRRYRMLTAIDPMELLSQMRA